MRLVSEKDYLEHHGIKGQKWGVRRYQNPDGSLTDAGKKHYTEKLDSKISKAMNLRRSGKKSHTGKERVRLYDQFDEEYSKMKTHAELDRLENAYRDGKIKKDRFTKQYAKARAANDKEYKELEERFIRPLAKATLRDLSMKDNEAMVDLAEEYIRNTSFYRPGFF